ncbi:MAG: tRNA preQ1(34) S-adenosylmethionine ribosyltransferase-isomerase QueA, partial [Rickettsiales bacterium]|nr:tRNA preQ1(34) S-adenosylmethionine ribosyltransferase-isomerase QueA [Rickettsiales bacterium]
MRTELFDFHLPEGRIAHAPATPRDAAKLLHVGGHGHDNLIGLRDYTVRDLPSLLNPGDVMVFNDSRVIPARLFADVGGKQVEVLLHQPLAGTMAWQAFARPAKKLKKGMVLAFAPDFSATVMGRSDDGQVLMEFPCSREELFAKLRSYGHMPLPPYIERADAAEDKTDYQTIYAREDGSVAAPTAGLHFTPALMDALDARGVKRAYVTLHVGAGTFQPVKVEDTDAHIMHREPIEIGQAACDIINTARAAGGKVVAVGTTSLRILESVAALQFPPTAISGVKSMEGCHASESWHPAKEKTGCYTTRFSDSEQGSLGKTASGMTKQFFEIQPYSGDTGIFITPGYPFKIVDRLMTNFHLPKSTLFMLVSA